jgi:hypothetical protein
MEMLINFSIIQKLLALNLHSFDFWGEDKIVNRFKPRVAYGEAGTFAAFGSLFTIYGNTMMVWYWCS